MIPPLLTCAGLRTFLPVPFRCAGYAYRAQVPQQWEQKNLFTSTGSCAGPTTMRTRRYRYRFNNAYSRSHNKAYATRICIQSQQCTYATRICLSVSFTKYQYRFNNAYSHNNVYKRSSHYYKHPTVHKSYCGNY